VKDQSRDLFVKIDKRHGSVYVKKGIFNWAQVVTRTQDDVKSAWLSHQFIHLRQGENTYFCDPISLEPIYVHKNDIIYKYGDEKTVILSSDKLPNSFASFEDPLHTICLGDRSGNIREVQFPRLNLTLHKAIDSGKWECAEQRGWSLVHGAGVPRLGQTTGFLVLENESKERKVIFPVWDPKKQEKVPLNFSYNYEFSSTEVMKGRYVECDIKKDSTLVPKTLEARLYLSRIFLEKGYVDQAEELLFAQGSSIMSSALRDSEIEQLTKIVTMQASGDIGARTNLMRLRALYLLRKNKLQFPQERKEVIIQVATQKLILDYLERIHHIQTLDKIEEIFLLKHIIISDMSKIQMRLQEIQGSSGEIVSGVLQRKDFSKEMSWWNRARQSPLFESTRFNALKYKVCRFFHKFPFDVQTADEETVLSFSLSIEEECSHTTWKKAVKSGLAQKLYYLAYVKKSPAAESLIDSLNIKVVRERSR
jgi:hypothetical protein